jgi:hypothetical protein
MQRRLFTMAAPILFGLSTFTLSAQLTQREQDAATQRAYQASADEHSEVAHEAATAEAVATAVERVAETVVEVLAETETAPQ